MKRLIYSLIAVLVTSIFSACSSYNYYVAGLNKTDLSQYHTFAWIPGSRPAKNALANNKVVDLKIKDAATASLQSKGLKLQTDHPDLLVSYKLTVGRGVKTTYYYPGYYGPWGGWGLGWGYGWGYRPYYYYGSPFFYDDNVVGMENTHYKESTLIIDLVDRNTKRIVWRGFGVGDAHRNPQKNIDDLPKVVAGIINQLNLERPTGRVVRSSYM